MATEQKLIKLLNAQDCQAISLLYDRFGAALYGVVLRIVGDEALAEDVLQDTFVKVWKNGKKYDRSKGKLFTWLLNIARNTAIDTIRSSHYRRKSSIEAIDNQLQNNSSHAVSLNTDEIGLQREVNRLDAKYQTVIDLVYFKGYTHKEVEKELGIPLGTVKTRLKIGLRELRKVYLNAPLSIASVMTVLSIVAYTFGLK